ncbi:MAG TPA: ABC transporter permease [Bacteroides sp.]|nr:ABC transporter permease [Bacteroides sp.]
MKEYLKIAWRNIWRNKRRTLITIASVFFALWLALIMRAMQTGSYKHMANGIVEAFTGSIQIHHKGYWNDQTLDNTFEFLPEIATKVESVDNIKSAIPRLESFALASTGEQTKGILVVGIDPVKELDLTHPDRKLVEGEYFSGASSNGVLVSSKLAGFLRLSVGDTLTLLSTGYHGASAAGIFPVIGIVKMPNPELNRRIVFLTLTTAQELYAAYNMLTSLVLNIEDTDQLVKIKKDLTALLDDEIYEIMDWKEMNPELVQQIQSDEYGGYIMLAMLYLIVGFGVLGTLIMMTTERRKEFGVMIAIGMQKKKLGLILSIEMLFMAIVGVAAGVIGSLPVIGYLVNNPIQIQGEGAELFESYGFDPIMPAEFDLTYFISQSVVVLVIFVLATIYPVRSVLKLNEIKALRS